MFGSCACRPRLRSARDRRCGAQRRVHAHGLQRHTAFFSSGLRSRASPGLPARSSCGYAPGVGMPRLTEPEKLANTATRPRTRPTMGGTISGRSPKSTPACGDGSCAARTTRTLGQDRDEYTPAHRDTSILHEDLKPWRQAFLDAGHPARDSDFIIPGDLTSPRHGVIQQQTRSTSARRRPRSGAKQASETSTRSRQASRVCRHPRRHPLRATPRRHLPAPAHRGSTSTSRVAPSASGIESPVPRLVYYLAVQTIVGDKR
jgi:hypothetical protein